MKLYSNLTCINFINHLRCREEFLKDYMEDLDRNEFVSKLAEAETEAKKKAITAGD